MPTRPPKHNARIQRAASSAPAPQRVHENRPSARQRGYDTRWDKARKGFLAHHPLCVHCLADAIVTSATVVDHIDPHKGDMVKFWTYDNWQSLCKRHHDIKTATEDGGFGRPRKHG